MRPETMYGSAIETNSNAIASIMLRPQFVFIVDARLLLVALFFDASCRIALIRMNVVNVHK